MKKTILNVAGAQELTKNEQKSINGGVGPRCTDSNIECTNVGNSACPTGQGCFLLDPDSLYALCKCLK